MARGVKRRKPCRECGGPKEPGQQWYCKACDTPETQEKRLKAIKQRNKAKGTATRQAEREGLPLAERARVWRKDIPDGLGWCSGCKKLKAREQFTGKVEAGSRGGAYCKPCRSKMSHKNRLKRYYSISVEKYEQLLEQQGGCCAICGLKPRSKRLAVDHDHRCCAGITSCGSCIRGLLCTHCNTGLLANVRDNVDTLQQAIDYLKDPPAKRRTHGEEAVSLDWMHEPSGSEVPLAAQPLQPGRDEAAP